MARPSPATSRLIELLNFLARHPAESFRLSELARRLDFNKATAHGMLGALTDAEYLRYDDDTKTFGLGPAVVTLGYSAIRHDSQLAQIAEEPLAELSRATGSQAIANVEVGDEFVVIASQGRRASGRGTFVGYRGRMVPPLGMVFHAWASQPKINAWLKRVALSPQEHARYEAMLATIRQRGFSISADQEARERLEDALEQIRTSDRGVSATEELRRVMHDLVTEEHELLEIVPDRRYRTRQISAPVFDGQRSVRMGILLTGLDDLLGADLIEHAAKTVETAQRLTQLVAGTLPPAADEAAAPAAAPARR